MLALLGAIIAIFASAYLVYRMERSSLCTINLQKQVLAETKELKKEISTLADFVAVDCTECLETDINEINKQIKLIRSAPRWKEPKENVRRKKDSKCNNSFI